MHFNKYISRNTKRLCFSNFQSNWKSVEEISNGPGPDLTGNFNLANSVLVSTSSSDSVDKPILTPKVEDLLMGLKMEKNSLTETGKLRLLA